MVHRSYLVVPTVESDGASQVYAECLEGFGTGMSFFGFPHGCLDCDGKDSFTGFRSALVSDIGLELGHDKLVYLGSPNVFDQPRMEKFRCNLDSTYEAWWVRLVPEELESLRELMFMSPERTLGEWLGNCEPYREPLPMFDLTHLWAKTMVDAKLRLEGAQLVSTLK